MLSGALTIEENYFRGYHDLDFLFAEGKVAEQFHVVSRCQNYQRNFCDRKEGKRQQLV